MDLEGFWFEVILIFILILLNAFFAGAEMAIISARRSRIKILVEEGKRGFLATIQIGITIIASLASALGGAIAVEILAPQLARLPVPAIRAMSDPLALGIVVIIISYLTLVFGELIPKSLALTYSEAIACWAARPIDLFSRWTSFLVKILAGSSRGFMRLFGVKEGTDRPFISEEEVKYMIKEGRERGIFDETEQELIHSVFEFSETYVKDVMVPRSKMEMIDIDTPSEEVLKIMVEKGFSRYPVYKETPEQIVGILYNKDLLRALQRGRPFKIRDILRRPYFVPETTLVGRLLKDMQKNRIHMALVINEYGEIEGLVTIEDLVEEIVGEIEDESVTMEETRPVERLKDGSLIIDATVPLRDLDVDPSLPIEESEDYDTLAGFILFKLQSLPKGGEIVYHKGYKFTIVDMEGRRISKVKVEKVKE